MDIAVHEEHGVHIVRVTGRLIIGSPSDKLNAALEKLEAGGSLKIIVNLDAVEQIDSSGLATLVRHMSLLRRDSGALRLVCGEGRVREALTITRLLEAIPTYLNESAALAAFS
ncbi:MAG: STAS domain-containing protein [Acidobacteriia bacterium]|nr:STAS domain-containing protein [Terriglobia bacterium]